MTERGSTTHSPRVDDQLARDTRSLTQGSPVEARADEARMMEPPADGEPLPDAYIPVDEIELRSLLATSLRPSAFPADRDVLVAVAIDEGAPEAIVLWLEMLPPDTVFPTLEAAWEALGGKREQRDHPEVAAPPTAEATEPETEEVHVTPVQRLAGVAIGIVEIAVGVGGYVVQRVRRLF